MPRYHFHSADGVREIDKDGLELDNLEQARDQAVRYAGAVLKESPQELWNKGQWRVEVTDSQNVPLFTVITIAVDAPRPANSG